MQPGPGGAPRDSVERLAALFARIAGACCDHRVAVLVGSGLLLLACLHLASGLRFDNSYEAYFDRSDPTYAAYLAFREDFGSDEVAYLLYRAPGREHGVFDLDVMRRIARLTRALETEVPFALEVTSLVNAEFLEGVPGGIEVGELLDPFPDTQEELLRARARALGKPFLVGGMLDEAGAHGAILVEMDRSGIDPLEALRLDPQGGDGLENLYPQVSHAAIEAILARPEYADLEFFPTGDVPMTASYNRIAAHEAPRLGAITLLVIGLLLAVSLRSAIGVLGPLVVVALSFLVTLAVIRLLGWDLNIFYAMLPTLIIAVGVADSVHIVSEFHAVRERCEDRREAMVRTLYLVGPPCLLTSLTTATAFGALGTAKIVGLAQFAVYTATGVLAAFLLSMTLFTVFFSFGRQRRAAAAAPPRARLLDSALLAIARFDVRHRRAILAATGLVFAASALGITRLEADSNFLTELAPDVPVRRATEYTDAVMGGTNSLIYLFDAGRPDAITEPAVLREMEALQAEAERHRDLVAKTYSIVDILKDLNQSFHGGDPAHHVLPERRELVAQYVLLYEMSGGEEAEEYLSSDRSRASLELRYRSVETSRVGELVAALDAYRMQGSGVASRASVTGIAALWLRLVDYIVESQIVSFLLAFAVIAALLCAIFRSVATGLIAMLPNVSPPLLTLGLMGWLGVDLDYNKLMIATVAIGLAVDDTIHHVIRFRHEFQQSGRYASALAASLRDVGRALFVTSAALVGGFLVLLLSVLDSQAHFGILLAFTIAVALAADFFLMPALVMTFEPFGPERTG